MSAAQLAALPKRRKCHEFETDLGVIAVRQPRTPRSHVIDMSCAVRPYTWTRRLVEARGWRYEVWSGAPSPELENLRFLAGYRRPWLFDAALLDKVRGADVGGRMFGEVVRGLVGCDPAAARAAVLNLLWLGELKTDLSTPLSDRHQLARPV